MNSSIWVALSVFLCSIGCTTVAQTWPFEDLSGECEPSEDGVPVYCRGAGFHVEIKFDEQAEWFPRRVPDVVQLMRENGVHIADGMLRGFDLPTAAEGLETRDLVFWPLGGSDAFCIPGVAVPSSNAVQWLSFNTQITDNEYLVYRCMVQGTPQSVIVDFYPLGGVYAPERDIAKISALLQ